MKLAPHRFSVISQDQDLPITSMYVSWDWSKPSASNRERLTDEIKAARKLLKQELSDDKIQQYLAPFWNVMATIRDPIPDLTGLALFRTEKDFWCLQLAHDPGTFTVVSKSFHIKPLLVAEQDPNRFAILWFHERGATLAYVTERQMTCSDTVVADSGQQNSREFLIEVKKMLNQRVSSPEVQVILAGDHAARRKARAAHIYENLSDLEVHGFSSRLATHQLEDRVKFLIRECRRSRETQLITDLLDKVDSSREAIFTDLEKITPLAVRGQIKTLVIAKDRKLFGKINHKTGEVIIHGVQMDCHDDDLYDDIAECVKSQGGEVLVVSEKLIPGGTGIVAITLRTSPTSQTVQVA